MMKSNNNERYHVHVYKIESKFEAEVEAPNAQMAKEAALLCAKEGMVDDEVGLVLNYTEVLQDYDYIALAYQGEELKIS